MNVFECIMQRRSVRSYTNRKIPEEALNSILEAGRWAPSAGNSQPWQFIVIRNKDILGKIAEQAPYGSFTAEAQLAIAVVTDPSTSWHKVDGSSAVQNMALAAWEMGIGTCWLGSLNREEVKKILGVPDKLHLLTVLPFGYPAEVEPSTRKELASMLHQDKW